MNQRKREDVGSLLQAARILAAAGRKASAAALRDRVGQASLLIALAGMGRGRSQHGPQKSSAVRVAAILDEFSTNSFSATFKGTFLLPERWKEQFEEARPQVFFCESAWSGADSKIRPWKGRIYASKNFQKENRGVLLDILSHCRKSGIPTVFWNKEDPTHYADRVHDFVKTAKEFDHVFTTSVECVPKYKEDYGLESVHALPFATNPLLFNPIEILDRSNAVTFAGSWYANHIDRSIAMHKVLSELRASGYELEIYDRYHGDSDPLHKWPEEYSAFIRPSVPHDEIAAVYKRSRAALNINTVTDSRTMFARRVFELMSSNTLVLSNYSLGIEEMFGDDVVFCDREPGRFAMLTPQEIDSMRERNLQRVLKKHTYRNRWEEVLTKIAFKFSSENEAITVVWPVQNEADAYAGINWFQQEADIERDKLLFVAMEEVPPLEVASLCRAFNRFNITVTSLGHALDLSMDGRYAPVVTDHIALIRRENLPEHGWLARARGHLQYVGDTPIAPAKGTAKPYTFIETALNNSPPISLCMRTRENGNFAGVGKIYLV